MLWTVGHVDQFGWVLGYHIHDDQHTKKGAQARKQTALAGDGNVRFVEFLEQALDMDGGYILRLDAQRLDIAMQMFHVAQVCLNRIVGKVALQTQMRLKIADVSMPVHVF